MQKIPNSQAIKFQNSPVCKGIEFKFEQSSAVNIAIIDISGRYPSEGTALNEMCDEFVYVIEGSGALSSEGEKLVFSAGDSLFIEKMRRFAWEGQCKVIIACNPAFYPEQHKEIK